MIMLKKLLIRNVGPAPLMEMEPGPRLNLITGDNGLGKSFLLDTAWWAMTRKWPAEVNSKLTTGRMALPNSNKKAVIEFVIKGKTRDYEREVPFSRASQSWNLEKGRPGSPGIVIYAMSDEIYALWDPLRNYGNSQNTDENVAAYVFSPNEIWDGLELPNEKGWLCNGLIRDWALWQTEGGRRFDLLKKVLAALSPSEEEKLAPGNLTRISIKDVRDVPTIKMPYKQEVPVINASSAIKRILALAYLLVWAWEEHLQAAKISRKKITNQIILLVDEIEAHLHPTWQRRIIPALITAMDSLSQQKADVQFVFTTHAPLVMASLETVFDGTKDKWFDIDLRGDEVSMASREFQKQTDAAAWLTSEAFNMKSARSLEAENLTRRASALLDSEEDVDKNAVRAIHEELIKKLTPYDPFLTTWRYICSKKGWLDR